ncbi:MAG: PspC family transcriptional regulator [Bacteroidia bacterium]|nr:PspC family transcriptional regulator [Bacteroidia bacterium]
MCTVQSWFEQQAFGVCTWWGNKLGIRSKDIRMYFIYLSFFTAGSPGIIYFAMAFILEHKDYFKFGRQRATRITFWDI